MVQACNFIKKETLAQMFSCEFCEIFKNTFFYGTTSGDCSCHNDTWMILKLMGSVSLLKKRSFPLRISSVNVPKSAGNCEFGHIY